MLYSALNLHGRTDQVEDSETHNDYSEGHHESCSEMSLEARIIHVLSHLP